MKTQTVLTYKGFAMLQFSEGKGPSFWFAYKLGTSAVITLKAANQAALEHDIRIFREGE